MFKVIKYLQYYKCEKWKELVKIEYFLGNRTLRNICDRIESTSRAFAIKAKNGMVKKLIWNHKLTVLQAPRSCQEMWEGESTKLV